MTKRTILLALSSMALLNFYCSSSKKNAATPPPIIDTVVVDTVPAGIQLNTLHDSASYAVGLSVANFYRQQGITTLNQEALIAAITSVFDSSEVLFSDIEANDVMNRYNNFIQEEKTRPVIDSGRAFLERNKLRPEVKTTESGLQYEVLQEGNGTKPSATSTVVAHYAGKLLDGTEFDNSYKRGEPLTIPVNRVIKGWTEGLQLMNPGAKYRLFIPYELGYGLHGSGPIPGGAVLIFDVELIKIEQ